MNHRRLFRIGVFGSILLALCCLTPALFLLLTAVGLAAWTGWLDVVLIPAFALCLALTLWAWRRCRRDAACAVEPNRPPASNP
jgi:membrane protein implicated in regulation of membrane protease activity